MGRVVDFEEFTDIAKKVVVEHPDYINPTKVSDYGHVRCLYRDANNHNCFIGFILERELGFTLDDYVVDTNESAEVVLARLGFDNSTATFASDLQYEADHNPDLANNPRRWGDIDVERVLYNS